MLAIIGDIHGEFGALKKLISNMPEECIPIQVGDFGFWWPLFTKWQLHTPERSVYFIDGNHDDCRELGKLATDSPTAVWENAVFMPRGYVTELDGRTILFLGGASSVDRMWRSRSGVNAWQPEEITSLLDAQVAVTNATGKKIDLMITHTPPAVIIDKFWPKSDMFYRMWELPRGWEDIAAFHVQKVWEAVGKPPLYCGHMHPEKWVAADNCKVLGINEVAYV